LTNNKLIKGTWYEQGSSAQLDAELSVIGERYTLKTQTGVVRFGGVAQINASDRLGNIERKLILADDSVFATKDNESIDTLFKRRSKVNNIIHMLEANLSWAIIALALTVITGFAFFKWGVPSASHAVAQALPQETGNIIGKNTLKFLDDYLFEQISDHFYNTLLVQVNETTGLNDHVDYTLHFRSWGEDETAIPNALALPSGDIILTDKFVELSQNQDEIDSVVLHEIGHIEHRHTLEMIVQSTLVTTAVTLFTGDASGAADMGIGLGSLLLSTSYSRNFESEADKYAFEQMLTARIDPTSFANIMDRMTRFMEDDEVDENTNEQSDTEPSNINEDTSDVFDYLSTHPSTTDRIKQAEHYAKCYKKGLTICDALKI